MARRREILDAFGIYGSVALAARKLGVCHETVRRIVAGSTAALARAEAAALALAERDAAILAAARQATPEAPVRAAAIAEAAGVSTTAVHRVLRREGMSLPRHAPNKAPAETEAAILDVYAAGLGMDAVADKFELSRKTVWKIVRAAGIARPPNGPAVPAEQRLAAAEMVLPDLPALPPDPDPDAERRRQVEECDGFLDSLRRHHGSPDLSPSLRQVSPPKRRDSLAALPTRPGVVVDLAPALFGDPLLPCALAAPARSVPSARFPGITLARISCLEAGL